MADGGKLTFILILTAIGLQAPPAETPRSGPPPVSMPFLRITPDAVHELGPVAGIGSTTSTVWVASAEPARLVELDPAGKVEPQTVSLPDAPCGPLAHDFGATWVPLCASRSLARIDAKTREVTTTPLGRLSAGGGAIVTGVGSLWILADAGGTLQRLDPDTSTLVAEVYLPAGSTALAFGAKALWVAGGPSQTVVRVNPHTNVIEKSIAVTGHPSAIAIDGETVWVLAAEARSVVRIEADTNRVASTIPLSAPGGPDLDATGALLAASDGAVWVSADGAPLVRIEARTNRVTQVFTGGERTRAMAVAHRSIWMAGPGKRLVRIDPRLAAALR